MKMRAVVEIWLKSLIDEFTLGGLHSAMDPVAQSKATVQKTIASLLDAGDTHSNEMSFYSGQLWCNKLDKFGRFLASIKIILSFRF